MNQSKTREIIDIAVATIIAIVALAVLIGTLIAMLSGYKAWHRAQQRADANNRVRVTAINIRTAQQQAKVVAANDDRVRALADQRLIAARGIRNAQDEIQSTLTPLYVQFEAVQAQLAMAKSQNHTIIYVPAGTNGTPVITENGQAR
jgi:predicted histidine transporter YuiF (NhaC family)